MADLFYMVLFAWIAVNVLVVGIAIAGGRNRGQGRSST